MCKTCIFRPNNLMHLQPGRLRGMIDECLQNDGHIPCHETLDGHNSMCKGFYDRYATAIFPIRLARHLDLIQFD